MKRIETTPGIGAAPYQAPSCCCALLSWEKQLCQSTGTEKLIEDNEDPWDNQN